MENGKSVFERNYDHYMEQLRELSLEAAAPIIGGSFKDDSLEISLLGNPYAISHGGIADSCGSRPAYDICIILLRYVLLCPDAVPEEHEWVAFRDFRDSGPLTVYFDNDVERAIAACFSGKRDKLESAGKSISGYPPDLDAAYDLVLRFEALPRIPLLLLYNDADDEFPATCSVLFARRTQRYLDAECIAILGRLLFTHLRKAAWTR